MACSRIKGNKNRSGKFRTNPKSKGKPGKKSVGGNIKACYVCGTKYEDPLDPITLISFFNVLNSTIFLRNKYNLSNLPDDKRSQYARFCKQYSRLFVCPKCDKKVMTVSKKIYAAFKKRKR